MSLSNQIDAVYAAQQRQEASQRAAIDAQQQLIMRQQQRQDAQSRAATAQRAAQDAARAADAAADKKREQAFEDQLRQLQLETAKLELKKKEAQVARENDYIDQDLRRQAAQTDTVQAQADTARNLSNGMKNLMDQEGAAAIQAAKTGAPAPNVSAALKNELSSPAQHSAKTSDQTAGR